MTLEQKKDLLKEEIISATERMRTHPGNAKIERSEKSQKIAQLLATNNYGCKTATIQKLLEEVLDGEDKREAFVAGAIWAKGTKIAPAGARAEAEGRYTKESLAPTSKGISFLVGAMVVSANDAYYQTGTPVVITEGRRGIYRIDGEYGQSGSLPGGGLRMATKDEINAFVDGLGEEFLQNIMRSIMAHDGDAYEAEGTGLIT